MTKKAMEPIQVAVGVVILGCFIGCVRGCIRNENRAWEPGTIDTELVGYAGARVQPAVSLTGKRLDSNMIFSGEAGGKAVFTRIWWKNSAIEIHPVGSTVVLSLRRVKLTYTVREVSDSRVLLVRVEDALKGGV